MKNSYRNYVTATYYRWLYFADFIVSTYQVPLEEVLSFKLLGLTICHDLSWESHISKLASKASYRLGNLHHAKSFLGTPELLTV